MPVTDLRHFHSKWCSYVSLPEYRSSRYVVYRLPAWMVLWQRKFFVPEVIDQDNDAILCFRVILLLETVTVLRRLA